MTDQPTPDAPMTSLTIIRIANLLDNMAMPSARLDEQPEGDVVRFNFIRDLTDGERRKLQQRFKRQTIVGKSWISFQKPIDIPTINPRDAEIERLKAQVKLLQDELARERAKNTVRPSSLSESIRHGIGSFPRVKDVVAIRRDNISEHDLTQLLCEDWKYFDSWNDEQYHLWLIHEQKPASGETVAKTTSVTPQPEASEFTPQSTAERTIEVIGAPVSFNPVANFLLRNFERLLDSDPLIRAVDEMEADEVIDIMNDENRQRREARLAERPAISRPKSLLLQE